MPPQEVESFRQLVSTTLPMGSNIFWTRWKTWISVSPKLHIELIEGTNDLRDGEIFPRHYYEPLTGRQLWNDEGVRRAWERGNEAALPEKYAFLFFSCCKELNGAHPKFGIFLLWPRSAIQSRLRPYSAGHCAHPCADNRHH